LNIPGARVGQAKAPFSLSSKLRRSFLSGIAIPAGLLIFYAAAPSWLNHRLHESVNTQIDGDPSTSRAEKEERQRRFAAVDFEKVALGQAGESAEALRSRFEHGGVSVHFERLVWSFRLTASLVILLIAVEASTLALSRRARRSSSELIASYKTAWRLTITMALVKVFLLIPLLAYGIYEFTTLAADRIFPQLMLFIVIGGLIALWRSARILVRPVPLEFNEKLARIVTPGDAPALWSAIRDAASRLQTAPPDHILLGMKDNFYVTELSVITDGGKVEGRTLYLSLPLIKRLAPEEVLAIVGHELGHFMGSDTQITREFYPLRFKANATILTLARSGWVGWASVHSLIFFNWCFGSAELETSRERELKADQIGARLTSPETLARALVRFHIFSEALRLGLLGQGGERLSNPYEASLAPIIRERLLPKEAFWNQLFEARAPHPLDSHPALNVRLEAFGQHIGPQEAKAFAIDDGANAYACWFGGQEALFTGLARQADEAVGKARAKVDAVKASYETAEGRDTLERLFPERRWSIRRFSFWLPVGFLALAAAVLFVCAITEPLATPKIACTIGGLLAAWWSIALWRQNRNGEFLLRADSINYTGWHRPLKFSDVQSIQAIRSYGNVTVRFRLKARQPVIWKSGLNVFRRRMVSLSLGMMKAKPKEVLEVLHRYMTRQVSE
jgi:Zn-dependent protease with chaperone function